MATYGSGRRYGSGARYGEPDNHPKKMSKLRRELKEAPIDTKTSRGTEIITACTGNAALGDITAPLAAFSTSNGNLSSAAGTLAAREAAVDAAVPLQDAADADWNAKFETLLATIEGNTQGSKPAMATTTVGTYEPGPGTAAGTPAKITGLSVTIGDIPHSMDVQWNAQTPKPRIHILRMCEGAYNPANMVQIGMPSASKFTVRNLLAGHTYWFEVCAVAAGDQQGPWSDPATGMAV